MAGSTEAMASGDAVHNGGGGRFRSIGALLVGVSAVAFLASCATTTPPAVQADYEVHVRPALDLAVEAVAGIGLEVPAGFPPQRIGEGEFGERTGGGCVIAGPCFPFVYTARTPCILVASLGADTEAAIREVADAWSDAGYDRLFDDVIGSIAIVPGPWASVGSGDCAGESIQITGTVFGD